MNYITVIVIGDTKDLHTGLQGATTVQPMFRRTRRLSTLSVCWVSI